MDGLACRSIAPPTDFLLQGRRALDSKYCSNSEGAGIHSLIPFCCCCVEGQIAAGYTVVVLGM